MESSCISIIYQNQLFAEGLESLLQHNHYKVIKKEISELNLSVPGQLSGVELFLIEADWPFPNLGCLIEKIGLLSDSNPKIILISNLVNHCISHLACKSKICGIILMRSSKEELLFGMKQVMEGKVYYSSSIANLFLKSNNEIQIFTITKREKQILSLLAQMQTSEEIANNLFITKSTVKTHRRNLMRKFDSKNTLCLLRSACRENLLSAENNFCRCQYCMHPFKSDNTP